MPDTPVDPSLPPSYPPDMESRVAVLEQIARGNAAAFDRVDRRFEQVDRRFQQLERRLEQIATEHHADFRWLVGIMLAGFGTLIGMMAGMLGAMAHGFHWL